MSDMDTVAAALEAVADYIEDELASGKPPKAVARDAAMNVTRIAFLLRTGELP